MTPWGGCFWDCVYGHPHPGPPPSKRRPIKSDRPAGGGGRKGPWRSVQMTTESSADECALTPFFQSLQQGVEPGDAVGDLGDVMVEPVEEQAAAVRQMGAQVVEAGQLLLEGFRQHLHLEQPVLELEHAEELQLQGDDQLVHL